MVPVPNSAELALGLRRWASGSYADEASVELLIRHGSWLRRSDFRRLVHFQVQADGSPWAWADWHRLLDANLPCSSSEGSVLAIAAVIAGHPEPEPGVLRSASLDDDNLTLILRAVAHAGRGFRGAPLLPGFDTSDEAPSTTVGRTGPLTRTMTGVRTVMASAISSAPPRLVAWSATGAATTRARRRRHRGRREA